MNVPTAKLKKRKNPRRRVDGPEAVPAAGGRQSIINNACQRSVHALLRTDVSTFKKREKKEAFSGFLLVFFVSRREPLVRPSSNTVSGFCTEKEKSSQRLIDQLIAL